MGGEIFLYHIKANPKNVIFRISFLAFLF